MILRIEDTGSKLTAFEENTSVLSQSTEENAHEFLRRALTYATEHHRTFDQGTLIPEPFPDHVDGWRKVPLIDKDAGAVFIHYFHPVKTDYHLMIETWGDGRYGYLDFNRDTTRNGGITPVQFDNGFTLPGILSFLATFFRDHSIRKWL